MQDEHGHTHVQFLLMAIIPVAISSHKQLSWQPMKFLLS